MYIQIEPPSDQIKVDYINYSFHTGWLADWLVIAISVLSQRTFFFLPWHCGSEIVFLMFFFIIITLIFQISENDFSRVYRYSRKNGIFSVGVFRSGSYI